MEKFGKVFKGSEIGILTQFYDVSSQMLMHMLAVPFLCRTPALLYLNTIYSASIHTHNTFSNLCIHTMAQVSLPSHSTNKKMSVRNPKCFFFRVIPPEIDDRELNPRYF